VILRTSEILELYRTPSSTTPRAIALHHATCHCQSYARYLKYHWLNPPTNRAHRLVTAHRGHPSTNTTAAMSLVNLAHVCSHLQNASKARLGLTSIPVSKLHVKLARALQQQGFLSSVTIAGGTPPTPFLLQQQPDPDELERMADRLRRRPWLAYAADGLKAAEEGEEEVQQLRLEVLEEVNKMKVMQGAERTEKKKEILAMRELLEKKRQRAMQDRARMEAIVGKEAPHTVKVPSNPAQQRLWLGLKYWQNEPVLKNMKLVSKPTRRIWLTSEDFGRITRTRESSYVKGLTHPGECMFVTTDRGILEARECVERRLGGMALCRVWG